MNLLFMAEGDPVEAIIIDDDNGKNMTNLVLEYNEYQDDFYNNPDNDDTDDLSLVEWLGQVKHIKITPLKLEVISMVDGYWYT